MGALGLESVLAFAGISPDNYLNTDKKLAESMKIGGFVSLVMPISAVHVANDVRGMIR